MALPVRAQLLQDSFNSSLVGAVPSSPWNITGTSANSSATIQNVSSGTGTDTNSLFLSDSDSSSLLKAAASFTSQDTTAAIQISFDVDMANIGTNNSVLIRLFDNTQTKVAGGLQFGVKSGALTFQDLSGATEGTMSYGSWYHVALTFPQPGTSGSYTVTLTDMSGTQVGTYTEALQTVSPNYSQIVFAAGTGASGLLSAYVNNIRVDAVPEPASASLLFLGGFSLLGLFTLARKRIRA